MSASIYTATFDRPDVARIWREAIRRTLTTPHNIAILYARDAPGTDAAEASWESVGLDERARPQMLTVFKVMPQTGARLFIEEDILPIRPWRAEDYVGSPAILQGPGGQTWWGFAGYADGPARPLMYSDWRYIPQRLVTDGGCPEWLPPELCGLAIEANAKVVGNHFLHVDKFSSRHPHSEAKESLFRAIGDYIATLPPLETTLADPPSFSQRAVNVTKPTARHVANKGPGTELKAILAGWPWRIKETTGCLCGPMATKMDKMGCDWCLGDGLPEILVVMKEEAKKRKLLWSETLAKLAIRRAVARARRKKTLQQGA